MENIKLKQKVQYLEIKVNQRNNEVFDERLTREKQVF